jgi:hypothetical protein
VIFPADRAAQHVVDGEHAAQRLEGAEAETLALVLDPDLADTQPLRQCRQRMQRRLLVRGAGGEHVQQLRHAVGVDDLELLLAAERHVSAGAGISVEPV